jgi:hypothetical protein
LSHDVLGFMAALFASDKHGIRCFDDDEVVHPDQAHQSIGGMY